MDQLIDFKTKSNLDIFLSLDEDHLDTLAFQGGFKRVDDTTVLVSKGFVDLLQSNHNKKILFGKRVTTKTGDIDYIPFNPQPVIISRVVNHHNMELPKSNNYTVRQETSGHYVIEMNDGAFDVFDNLAKFGQSDYCDWRHAKPVVAKLITLDLLHLKTHPELTPYLQDGTVIHFEDVDFNSTHLCVMIDTDWNRSTFSMTLRQHNNRFELF
jgi:hypothetical protein